MRVGEYSLVLYSTLLLTSFAVVGNVLFRLKSEQPAERILSRIEKGTSLSQSVLTIILHHPFLTRNKRKGVSSYSKLWSSLETTVIQHYFQLTFNYSPWFCFLNLNQAAARMFKRINIQ